jgi:hypothetical protein
VTLTALNAKYYFPAGFDERAEYEMEHKGHLCGGEVELEDGRRFPVTFFDLVRLSQDFEEIARRGEPVFIEPALVVIPEVTRAAIVRALPELVRQSFFDHLKPLTSASANGVTTAGGPGLNRPHPE